MDNSIEYACADCGQHVIDEDMLTETNEGTVVCQSCLDEDYVTTADGDIIYASNAGWCHESEQWYYDEETFNCEDCCNDFHSDFERCIDEGNRIICEGCLDRGDYVFCHDTEDYHHYDSVYYCEHSENYYAHSENMQSNPNDAGVYNYDTDIFEALDNCAYIGKDRDTWNYDKLFVMGVELETEVRDCGQRDIALAIEDTTFGRYGILKNDGSISGLELVTLPADLDAHRYQYQWGHWCEALRPVAKGHYGSNNGMHIHVNRGAISALTLGKILVFMNDEKNADVISTIAQRDVRHNRWCEMNGTVYDKVGKSGKLGNMTGKYSAVNVTHHTIEFRIFNATLLPERIIKNLEFCHALARYCEQESARKLSADNFIPFVMASAKTYPELSKFIMARIIMPAKVMTEREAA